MCYRSLPSWTQGTTDEQYDRRREAETRVTELAATLYAHAYWSTLSGPELVAARDAIKHAEGAVPPELADGEEA